MKISVIIPTFKESLSEYLPKALKSLEDKVFEIIIVDKDSDLGSLPQNLKLIKTNASSRAQRLNLGVEKASGEIIILHHPRSTLDHTFIEQLKKIPSQIMWGAFTHKFDYQSPLLRFTSWYSNYIRGDLRGIFYLDHCFFIRAPLAKSIFPIKPVDIFEDTIISKKLKNYPYKRLNSISTTSAIRFKKNGIIKQSVKNQFLKIMYYLKFDHQRMNKIYEKKSPLNTEYTD